MNMKDLVIDIFGEYEPIMWTNENHEVGSEEEGLSVASMEEITGPSTYIADGVAFVDWPWLAGVLLFTVVLWSLFRLLGVFFNGR